MDELRRLHLVEGADPPNPAGPVLADLNAAFHASLAEATNSQVT